jgi:hypothetical protein
MLFTLLGFGQKKKDSITIDRQQYERDQQLQSAICNLLQYVNMEGKVIDKAKFKEAMRIYLEALKTKEEGK